MVKSVGMGGGWGGLSVHLTKHSQIELTFAGLLRGDSPQVKCLKRSLSENPFL
jgi:galactokinase